MASGNNPIEQLSDRVERLLAASPATGARASASTGPANEASAGTPNPLLASLLGRGLAPLSGTAAASQGSSTESNGQSGWLALLRQFESLWGGGSGNSLFSAGLGTARSGGATSFGEELLSRVAGGMLGGPLGLIAGALGSLFRSSPEALSFTEYEHPESLMLDLDVGQASRAPRPGDTALPARAGNSGETQTSAAIQPAPPVLIQVNALDARSFSDHRDDIAAAVREALSRGHSLRDEMWED